MEQTTIDKLTSLGSEAVQNAIAEYTHWYVINSIGWMIVGAALLIYSRRMWRLNKDTIELKIAALVVAFVGMLFVATNLPTLFSPRAYAIHQLIKDAKR